MVTDLDPKQARAAIGDFRIHRDVEIVGVSDIAARLAEVLEPGDVVVTGVPPTAGGIRRDATRLARAVSTHTVVVVVRVDASDERLTQVPTQAAQRPCTVSSIVSARNPWPSSRCSRTVATSVPT